MKLNEMMKDEIEFYKEIEQKDKSKEPRASNNIDHLF